MIALVYLAWGPLGISPVREFISSYREHRAGREHELIILLNGADAALREEIESELEDVRHRVIATREPVQDLTAYAEAASHLGHERLCFLNSYSTILAADWLAKLDAALSLPGVGLVGATGSWASHASLARYLWHLPTPYAAILGPDRGPVDRMLQAIERGPGGEEASDPSAAGPAAASQPRAHGRVGLWRRRGAFLVALARSTPHVLRLIEGFEAFPNPHLRTNAFAVDRDLFVSLEGFRLSDKLAAHLLESGPRSITKQVSERGLRVLVVNRAGAAHEHHGWPASETFWHGEQENLLVADNQTRFYARSGRERRALLAGFAWGLSAADG